MEGMDNEETETETETKTKTKEPTTEEINDMKEKYSELFELQNNILDGMDKVTKSLDRAEPIFNKIKEKFESS